ncbi:MAG TPA: DNA mismatch repair endonuclease MutL, partial [Ktedonobacterales bacterium]|nr:DNA mismatch repair endonuclease MutL [Ktedonobacterales bacterium]
MDNLPLKPRMPISLLGSEVIERIAAGEVIERPASALRELVENALDADARAIRVELREGGIRLLRVSDDGVGIRAEELEMAVAPHATNKLRRLADLDHIETLGFRGEALASLTAVAEVHICSTADDSGIGHTLLARPGHTLTSGLEGRACGTTVTVRDLFHLM